MLPLALLPKFPLGHLILHEKEKFSVHAVPRPISGRHVAEIQEDWRYTWEKN